MAHRDSAGGGISIDSSNVISSLTVPLTGSEIAASTVSFTHFNQNSRTAAPPARSSSGAAWACADNGVSATLSPTQGGTGLTAVGSPNQVLAVNTALQFVDAPRRTVVTGLTYDALSASLATTQLSYFGAPLGYMAPYAGILRGVCMVGDAAPSAGTGSFTVHQNATATTVAVSAVSVAISGELRDGDLCGYMVFHGSVARDDGKTRPQFISLQLQIGRTCLVEIPRDFGHEVQCGSDPQCSLVVTSLGECVIA